MRGAALAALAILAVLAALHADALILTEGFPLPWRRIDVVGACFSKRNSPIPYTHLIINQQHHACCLDSAPTACVDPTTIAQLTPCGSTNGTRFENLFAPPCPDPPRNGTRG